MKACIIFILPLLFFFGCLKDDDNTPGKIVEIPTFSYVASWTEIGSKTGEADWVNISDGQRLSFFSDSIDEELGIPYNGLVRYKPGLSIHIKDNLSFQRIDNTLVFYYFPYTAEADTVSLAFRFIDSTTLVISDTTTIPTVEIKYKRDK
jgi:hypothetical protein